MRERRFSRKKSRVAFRLVRILFLIPFRIDTEPFPATAAKWKYKGIFRKDDERIGQWSDVTEITVG